MTKKKLVLYFIVFLLLNLNAEDIVHIIQKGETVYALSKKYNISITEILEKNNIEDASHIKIGQKLIIPKKIKTPLKNKEYIVKKGDTLFGLSKKFGVTFSSLLTANNLTNNSILKIGQRLKIPQAENLNSNEKKEYIAPKNKNLSKKDITTKPSITESKTTLKQADAKLKWPVPTNKVYYLAGKIPGVVIETVKGETVKSITSGKVVSATQHRGFGKVVFVQSKTKHIYVYGGIEKVFVKKGQTIKTGDKLGEVGTELFIDKAKVFFMVYYKNKPIDPEKAYRGM